MPEPITLTVGTIAALAFTKFLESSAGETGKQLTQKVLEKINELRKKILDKLHGIPKVEALKASVERDGKLSDEQINNDLVPHLESAMTGDEEFAKEIQKLASEIDRDIDISEILGKNVMNVYGGSAVQINDPNAPVLSGISGGIFTFNTHNH